MRPRPILYVAPWAVAGGSDKGTLDWFRTIDRSRFDPYLVTTNRAEHNMFVPQLEPFAVDVWNLPDLLDDVHHAGFVFDLVGRLGVEVVHIMNSQLGFDLIPAIRAHHPHVAVVVQQHAEEHDESLYVRYVATRYGHLVHAYSATSEDLKRRIVGYGVDPDKVEVIYTGIDADREWVPGPRPEPEPGAPLRILYPGRLEHQKDPQLMVRVAEELRARHVPFVLDVVGDGSLRPELESLVASNGLHGAVRFHGVRSDMAAWYQQADVLLMTSRFEGIPYVIFEAMAMALPVVVPDINANAELVDDTVGALVVERADVGSYADALTAMALDRRAARHLGAAARRRVIARFPLHRMARAHEQLYDRLSGAVPPPTGPGAGSLA